MRFLSIFVAAGLMLAITTAAPPEEGPKTDIPLNLPAAKDLPEHLDLTGLDETGLERVRVKYEQGKTDLRATLRRKYKGSDNIPAHVIARAERDYWERFKNRLLGMKARRDKELMDEVVAETRDLINRLPPRELEWKLRGLKDLLKDAETRRQGTFKSPMVRQRNEGSIKKYKLQITELEGMIRRMRTDTKPSIPPDRIRRQLERAKADLEDAEAKLDSVVLTPGRTTRLTNLVAKLKDKVAELENDLNHAESIGLALEVQSEELRKKVESAKTDLKVAEDRRDSGRYSTPRAIARNRELIKRLEEDVARLTGELEYAVKREAEAAREGKEKGQARGIGKEGNLDRAEMSTEPNHIARPGESAIEDLLRKVGAAWNSYGFLKPIPGTGKFGVPVNIINL